LKFTNLGSNIIILLLLSALGWGGIFALFAVWLIGAPTFVGWSIVLLFLLGTLVCLCLMGLEIFRPADLQKKQDAARGQPLKHPPHVPAQQLDDFPKAASPPPPEILPLPVLQISLPTLAPLQQHALGGVIVRQMQPVAPQTPAAPPITQPLQPQSAITGRLRRGN